MQVSARILGQCYGLTAEEMNRVLVKQGFLKGTPGNYDLTDKAIPYAAEKNFHIGTGGYSFYNRYWTERTFDESIKDKLNISSELKSEVRKEAASDRATRYAAQAAAWTQANKEFLAKQAAETAEREAEEIAAKRAEILISKLKKAGKIGIIVGGLVIVGYGVYKVTPKIKKWRQERGRTEIEENETM